MPHYFLNKKKEQQTEHPTILGCIGCRLHWCNFVYHFDTHFVILLPFWHRPFKSISRHVWGAGNT